MPAVPSRDVAAFPICSGVTYGLQLSSGGICRGRTCRNHCRGQNVLTCFIIAVGYGRSDIGKT